MKKRGFTWKARVGALLALAALAAADPAGRPVNHLSLRAASEAASADQSLVLLIFSAEWCAPCRELKAKTLSAPEFLQQAGLVHLADVDVDSNQKLAASFSVEAIPAMALLTGDGKIVGRRTGFATVTELVEFISAGRSRARSGAWEGTAPTDKLAEYAKKAAADTLTTNDFHQLINLMGDADPADRAAASKILGDQREAVVPLLIESVADPYLGIRVAAAELLRRMTPDVAAIDPWQSPEELTNSVVTLRKWWSDTGKLPVVRSQARVDASTENSIKAELEALRGDDPVRRTAAMSALVGSGTAALPTVREALRRAEKSGDQRAIGLLDDVRWAILVPENVERKTGGVRQTLAHGKSLERQSAAERLGRAGAEAMPVLGELAGDADGLVAESAVRALSNIGGREAIPAMAALLKSPDSNLRMTAAQALGHSKNPDAIPSLVGAMVDTNEVVVCTAISAVQEALSGNNKWSPHTGALPPEIVPGLKGCLADSRWRVRAAAAEAAGKLSASELVEDIKKLTADPDGFVVQSALAALGKLNAAPDEAQLDSIGRRLPGLRSATVEMMLASNTKDAADRVTEIYNSGNVAEQEAVLKALAKHGMNSGRGGDADWKPMLTRAVASPEPRLHRSAAEALRLQPIQVSAPLIGSLLADDDAVTRGYAAEMVLKALEPPTPPVPGSRVRSSAAAKTNPPPVDSAQIAAWHTALLKRADPRPRLGMAAAIFATGDGKAELPQLLVALEKPELSASSYQQDYLAVRILLTKLSWPEGQPILDKLCASPALFAMAARQNGRAPSAAANYLMEPARFKAAMEPASGDALHRALSLLAGYGGSVVYSGDFEGSEDAGAQQRAGEWMLWTADKRTREIVLGLADCTNAAWRAAAIYALGHFSATEPPPGTIEKAITDPNEWVRRAAVQSLASRLKERPALEAKLGPLLSETNRNTAAAAAGALLSPEVRSAASVESISGYFRFEGHYGGDTIADTVFNDGRPMTPMEGKPAFLEPTKKWLATTKGSDSVPFALLLAQYGQFEGLDKLVAGFGAAEGDEENPVETGILAGITLSQDAKYLPVLRKLMAARTDDWQLRKVLQALQGMRGPEARQLRLDINKKLRSATNQ